MTDKCNCSNCGRDLYSESNILLETKCLVDDLINGMDADTVGRPIFALIIGDNGTDWRTSDTLTLDDDEELSLFIMSLEEIIKIYKEEK